MEDEELDQTAVLGRLGDVLSEMTDPSTTEEARSYARQLIEKQLESDLPGKQENLLTEMEKNTEEARAALRAAREKLMARRYNPADAWFALAGALGSPTRTGTIGETAANAATALRGPLAKKSEWEQARDASALGLDERSSALAQQLLALKLNALQGRGKIDADLAKEALKTLGKRVSGTGSIQDKSQIAVDKKFADDYVAWIQDGSPEAAKALEELSSARDRLRGYYVDEKGTKVPTAEDDYLTRQLGPTGRISGSISTIPFGVGKWAQDVLMPGAADIQETVEATIQRSLRPILGAQFTKEEGERLISRVYNPRMSREVNAARVERLLNQIREATENKNRAAQYFEEHGTLKGFRGKYFYTIQDFLPAAQNELAPRGDEESTGNPEDYAPAVDPDTGRPAPVPDEEEETPAEGRETTAGGIPIYEVDELPTKKKKNWLGFAEGGEVPQPEKIAVRLKNGEIVIVDADATQEEVLGVTEQPGEYDSAVNRALLGTLGAGVGYAGARAGLGAANTLYDVLPGNRETSAESRLLRLMERANAPPSQLATNVRKSNRAGVPTMILDESPDLRATGAHAIEHAGPEGVDLLAKLEDRQAGARERTNEQINKALAPDEFFSKEEELKKRLYGEDGLPSYGSKLYQDAFAKYPGINSKQLGILLDTPAGKKAVKKAMTTMKNKRLPIGKVNSVTGAVTKPSLEFLNQVKIEMDTLVNMAMRKGDNSAAKTIKDLRNAFRDELDAATIDPQTGDSIYKAARAEWETDSGVLDALREGRSQFDKMQPAEVRRRISEMTFEEKDAFRSGVAQSLYETLNNPSTDINAARRLVGSPDMRAKLATLFDNPNQFKVFEAALMKEMEMFDATKPIISRDATMRARAGDPPESQIARGARKAPTLGVFSPTYWALKYLRSKPEMTPEEAKEIVKLVSSSTPEELANFEKKLGKKFGRATRRKKRASKVGKAAAAIGALTGALAGGEDEEEIEYPPEEIVKRAEGGKVGTARELINALRNKAKTLDTEQLKHEVFNVAVKIGETPAAVWKALHEGMAGTAPVKIPAQPEQLAPFAKSMDAERQKLERLRNSIALRNLSPSTTDQLTSGFNTADLVYQRMMSEPSYENMRRLSEILRSLQSQVEDVTPPGTRVPRRRGGRAFHA